MNGAVTSGPSDVTGASPRSSRAGAPLRTGLWAHLVFAVLLLTSAGTVAAAPVYVADSQSGEATSLCYQRKTFRDDSGYFWIFYFDGTNTSYKRSDDTTGAAWLAASQLFYAGDVQPSVWFASDSVWVAFSDGGNVLVRSGVVSGATISWSPTYTALAGDATASYDRASVCRSTDGLIWITARVETPAGYQVCAVRSTDPNDVSSWQSAETISPVFPIDTVFSLVVPLTGGDVYTVWSRQGWIEGKRYVSGTGWEAAAAPIAQGVQGDPDKLFSAVSDRYGNVHLLYVSRFGPVCYRSYDGTAWSSEQVLSGPDAGSPSLSINPSNQRLYALWIEDRKVECRSAVQPASSGDWRTEDVNRGRARKSGLTSCYSSPTRVSWLFLQGRNPPVAIMTDGLAVAKISVLVSVSSFSFGTQPVNTWLPAQNTQITNDGTWSEHIYAELSQFTSGPFSWAISDVSNGADLCRAQWSTVSDVGPWNDVPSYGSEFLVTTDLPAGGSVTLYFRIQTPTSTSSLDQYSSNLTVRAEDS
ncbi:MAG: hypothetical protein JSW03_02210 [Candidatus Eiseniibacteriota bacterium]|nr:MAG: hypothetical protein JSW03_02210 [Candidatus Eisenbacteria bacterium]